MKMNFSPAMTIIKCIFIVSISCASSACLDHSIGGTFKNSPDEFWASASKPARTLVEKSFMGFNGIAIVDYHMHLMGPGKNGSAVQIKPSLITGYNIMDRIGYKLYLSAANVSKSGPEGDRQYMHWLEKQIEHFGHETQNHLLSLDFAYTKARIPDPKNTVMHVSNEYLMRVVARSEINFIPVASVHPSRKNATEILGDLNRLGVKYIKWSPNSQNIDPTGAEAIAFYKVMKKYDMVLITHGGSLPSMMRYPGALEYGNPLLLKNALDVGIRVIVTHSAAVGDCIDFHVDDLNRVPCYKLLIRMMEETAYNGILYADISGLAGYQHDPKILKTFLARTDLHDFLVNGSDYPTPGMDVAFSTRHLVHEGFLSKEEAVLLEEIYKYNPLLFDFVLKRTVKHPQAGTRFAKEIFMASHRL